MAQSRFAKFGRPFGARSLCPGQSGQRFRLTDPHAPAEFIEDRSFRTANRAGQAIAAHQQAVLLAGRLIDEEDLVEFQFLSYGLHDTWHDRP